MAGVVGPDWRGRKVIFSSLTRSSAAIGHPEKIDLTIIMARKLIIITIPKFQIRGHRD